jgi:hypothetical protein
MDAKSRRLDMLRRIPRFSCVFGIVLVSSFVLAQAEFSADIFNSQRAGRTGLTKIYFAKDKLRIDAGDSGHGGAVVVMNFATMTSTVLMTQQHMYMEMPIQSQAQRTGYAFFRAGDVENACGDWQKITSNQSGSCSKVGSESVNGRSTVKYEATNANGDAGHFWLDSKLRFPVKWDGKNSAGELRNIQEGTQPASLFEVPAGFTKMQIPAGAMQQPR